MEVNKIAAHIRYSKDIGGSWKSVELAAEADVTIMDDWTVCQAELYSQLSQQLRQLWHNGNGAALNGSAAVETAIQPLPDPELVTTTREHWCDEHQMAHTQKHGKDGSTWWSHKAPDGSWCRE